MHTSYRVPEPVGLLRSSLSKIVSLLSVLALVLVLGAAKPAHADTTQISVTNHWVANTGGKQVDHVQNFLTDLVVYYNPSPPTDNPLVLAASAWDEGGYGYGGYSHPNQGGGTVGRTIGKAEWFKNIIHSDTAWHGSTKCVINNLWARASYIGTKFVGHSGPPPVGDSAPFISCSDGTTIRSVVDPSAIAFDTAGLLLVADNGPDQNVKIFSLVKPAKLLRTFGDSGGVFAASKPGSSASFIPGQASPRRFWGIRGLGVDSLDNLYVGCTGIPEQTMGGTDIRVFSGKDSSLMWQVQGLSFVNSADADPASNGKDLYLNAKHFKMDYTKAPGKSWSLFGVTLDPFRFPNDPRLTTAMESVWERRINGKRFQFHTDMYGDFVYVVRFNDSSEIGIPTAFFCTYADHQTGWGSDSAPTWTRNETNKRNRWYWIDRNGDGIPQKSEFGIYENWNIGNQAVDVDEKGDIWLGGTGVASPSFRCGGLTKISAGALTSTGVPQYRMDSLSRYDIPYAENSGSVVRIKHLAGNDAAFLATSPNSWYSSAIYRYDHYSDTAKRHQTCRIDLGFNDNGAANINLDQNSAPMTLPWSFTADSDYVYATYLDNGRYSRARGEVTVYDARTCQTVGWIAPGSETGNFAGAADVVNAINVTTQTDGTKLVYVEEDGAGKVMVYRWTPPARKTSGIDQPTPGVSATARWTPDRRLVLSGLGEHDWTSARLFDPAGRNLDTWSLQGAVRGSVELPTSRIHGITASFLVLQSRDGSTVRLRVPSIL